MNNKYTIKNFRVFDKDGVTIPIKPITVLTGCNSSGKSSIVKSMVLLDTYIEKIQDDFKSTNKIDLKKYMLDFSNKENSVLGNFSRVLHRGSDSSEIDFSYTVHSLLLGEDVKVTLTFGSEENDELGNGFIKGITIETLEGDVLYKSYVGENAVGNFNILLGNFYRFVYGQYLIVKVRNYHTEKIIGEMTEQDLADFKKDLDDFKKQFSAEYGKSSIEDIVMWENLHEKVTEDLTFESSRSFASKFANEHPEIIDVSHENDSIFYMPLLDVLSPMVKDTIKDGIAKTIEGINVPNMLDRNISKILEDFYCSDFKTFGEYYHQKEHDFLCYSFNWGKRSPRLFSPRLWHVRQDSICEVCTDFVLFDDGNNVFNNMPEEKIVDFNIIYETLTTIDYAINKNNVFYTCDENFAGYFTYRHRMFEMFKDYIAQVITEVVTTAMPQNLSYVSSSLVNVKRLYSLESSDSFSILLKNYFNAKREFKKRKRERDTFEPGDFINKWIREFGVGHSIDMSIDEDGTGVKIRLYEDPNDTKGTLLSEQGYGITQLFVILLRIETAILESQSYTWAKNKRYLLNPSNLEESQLETFHAPSTIAIEEPEVHQHPKFQSMLAALFVDAYKQYNVQFIIETHSEYLIRKLQTLVGEGSISSDNTSLIYVYDADSAKRPLYTPQVKTIEILSDGRLADKFGEGFFDEADRLAMNLLTLKVGSHEEA